MFKLITLTELDKYLADNVMSDDFDFLANLYKNKFSRFSPETTFLEKMTVCRLTF